eukprot:jgi/Botrbrau1/22499/Bobra.114_2s0025.1
MAAGTQQTFSWYDRNTPLQVLPLGPGLAKCFPEDRGMKPPDFQGRRLSSHARAQFSVRDIEGAFSVPKNRLIRRVRNTNPLCPVYKLPNTNHKEDIPPAPKFLRDTLEVYDIPGAKANSPSTKFRSERNLSLDVTDIPGASLALCIRGRPQTALAAATFSHENPRPGYEARPQARLAAGTSTYLPQVKEQGSGRHPSSAVLASHLQCTGKNSHIDLQRCNTATGTAARDTSGISPSCTESPAPAPVSEDCMPGRRPGSVPVGPDNQIVGTPTPDRLRLGSKGSQENRTVFAEARFCAPKSRPSRTPHDADFPSYWFGSDGTLGQPSTTHKSQARCSRRSPLLHVLRAAPNDLQTAGPSIQHGPFGLQSLSQGSGKGLFRDTCLGLRSSSGCKTPGLTITGTQVAKRVESSTQTGPPSGILWDLPTRPMTAPLQSGLKWLSAPCRASTPASAITRRECEQLAADLTSVLQLGDISGS